MGGDSPCLQEYNFSVTPRILDGLLGGRANDNPPVCTADSFPEVQAGLLERLLRGAESKPFCLERFPQKRKRSRPKAMQFQ